MTSGGRPRRMVDYRLEAMEGELLLHHPERTTTLYFSETAALVWHLCDGTRTPEEIAALLAEQYPDAPVQDDVRATLDAFATHGAIEFV